MAEAVVDMGRRRTKAVMAAMGLNVTLVAVAMLVFR